MGLLDELAAVGRNPVSGGVDRSAWTAADTDCAAGVAALAAVIRTRAGRP